MRMVVLCAAVGMALINAAPASAEVVVREGSGVVVDHGYHHGWYRHHAECRTVKVRTRLPNGDVVIKTRHTC